MTEVDSKPDCVKFHSQEARQVRIKWQSAPTISYMQLASWWDSISTTKGLSTCKYKYIAVCATVLKCNWQRFYLKRRCNLKSSKKKYVSTGSNCCTVTIVQVHHHAMRMCYYHTVTHCISSVEKYCKICQSQAQSNVPLYYNLSRVYSTNSHLLVSALPFFVSLCVCFSSLRLSSILASLITESVAYY